MQLTLIDKKQETKDVVSFIFKSGEPIEWKAGQYLIYSLTHNNSDLRGKMRFFTISSAPFEKNPRLTTKINKNSSSFKQALSNLKLGENIQAKGPDGDFVVDNLQKKYVFIAGGIGITPFLSLLKQHEFEKKDLDIYLIYTNKDMQFPFLDEMNGLKLKNLKITCQIGRISSQQISVVKNFRKRIYYVSGPDVMVEKIVKLLEGLGIKKENIKEDYFSGYKNI